MILADILQLWNSAWPAGMIMLGLGSAFAVVLLVASEKLKVYVDPKIEQVHEVLPHLGIGGPALPGGDETHMRRRTETGSKGGVDVPFESDDGRNEDQKTWQELKRAGHAAQHDPCE